MNIVIVNCFDTYEKRVNLVYKYFIKKGHNVSIITSDFRHFHKVKRTEERKDFIFINTQPYYKNISIDRLKSHYKFSKDAFKIIEKINPDFIYVLLPANSLAKFASKYKRKHSNVKICFDIIDLWPESLPVRKIKSLPPIIYWKNMRDKNLENADFIITECELYKVVLQGLIDENKSDTIYLASKNNKIDNTPILDKNIINLCYLGSINNIIDIPNIVKLIDEINKVKPVVLHIIGDGEKKEIFISKIENTGAKVKYYGSIYDEKKKQRIFDICQFGLNMMRESVCVGLTMKSIDYFNAGLPIINNIKHDTTNIVNIHKIGFNITDDNVNDVAREIASIDIEKLMDMRKNTLDVFETMFSLQSFNERLENVFEKIVHKEENTF